MLPGGFSKKPFMKTLYTKSKTRLKLVAAAATLLLPCLAQAQTTILAWNLTQATGNEVTYGATTTNAHLAAATLSRSGTTTVATGQARSFTSSSFTQATKGDQGYMFSITPAANYAVSLNTINVKLRNVNSATASGPQGSLRWQYSLDGTNFTDLGTADIAMPPTGANGSVQTPLDISNTTALQNVTGTITLRLVAWNLSASTALLGIGRAGATDTTNMLAITGTVSPATPLPVSLQSFQANADHNDADLNWLTASEKNSSYFNVERSSNGRDFSFIGKVAARNNPSGASYTYTDAGALVNGTQYYRLQSVDKDGQASYSQVVRVYSDQGEQVPMLVYPNPASGSVTIESNLPGNSRLQLFNAMGRLVLERQLEKGAVKTQLNITSLTKGIYILKLQGNDKSNTSQLVIK